MALSLPVVERLDGRLAAALTWVGTACIGIAAFALNDSTPYPGVAALLPVAGAVAIIAAGAAAIGHRGAEALLGTGPFQRVGAWSYSWYLWHWPVLILGAALLGHSLSEVEALTMAGISLVLAVISFVLVEQPIRHMQLVVRHPSIGLAGGATLVAASLSVVALQRTGRPSSRLCRNPRAGRSLPRPPGRRSFVDATASVPACRHRRRGHR